MTLIHFPRNAPPTEVEHCLRENGYAIIDERVEPEVMDRIKAEMAPYMSATPFGGDSILGKRTKRTGGLIARSPTARRLVLDDSVIGVTERFLSHASTFQIHCTQIVALHPGAPAQKLHQDEVAWDMYPFPEDYHVQCNTLWAMSDYTEAMGATRIIPGSHRAGKRKEFAIQDSLAAEMKKGSVLLYDGKVYHGSGHNRSDKVRRAINLTYAVGWVRQEENQYLTCPLDVARTLPERLLKLMGYQCGAFALGYVNGFEDPMTVLGRADAGGLLGASLMLNADMNEDRAAFLRGAEF